MAHTPAPWTQAPLAPTEVIIEGADSDTMIATAREGLNGISREEAIANARLIAAAPELLEALQTLVEAERTGCNLDFAMRRAADAIAQAGGAA